MIPAAPWTKHSMGRDLAFHLYLALCTLFSILNHGYVFDFQDQDLFLPFVLKWNDPTLFPNDFFLSLPDTRESVTWIAVAYLARAIPLKALLLCLYILFTYLGLFLIHRAASAYWGSESPAWIALFLWMQSYRVPGVSYSTYDGYFTTRTLGAVFILWALLYFFKQKFAGSSAILAAGSLIHLRSVAPLFAAFGVTHLVRKKFREFLLLGGLGCISALILYALSWNSHPALFSRYTGEWLTMVYTMVDFFPQRWVFNKWLDISIYAASFLGLCALGLSSKRDAPRARESMMVFLGLALAAVAGFIGGLFGIVIVLQLCLFRGLFVVMVLLAIMVAGFSAELLESPSRWAHLIGIAAPALWVADDWNARALAVILIAVYHLRSSLLRVGRRVRGSQTGVLSALVALLALILAWETGRMFFGWRWASICPSYPSVVMAFVIAISLFMAGVLFPRAKAVLFPASFMFWLMLSPSPFMRNGFDVEGSSDLERSAGLTNGDRVLIAALVRAKVPKDATVLVPAVWSSFRVECLRSPFMLAKDFGGSAYSEEYTKEFIQRMKYSKVTGADVKGRAVLDFTIPLDEGELLSLSERYRSIHLDYLLSRRTYNLPIAGRAGAYTLYVIRPGGGG